MVTVTVENTKLLTRLGPQPVQGVSMANVALLRLDRLDSLAPGNKLFKLQPVLRRARGEGVRRIVSFGGAWSNHLHALAATGAEQGLETVGIVRGDDTQGDTAMLADARAWGMKIVRISRSDYRRRHDHGFLAEIERRYRPCLLVPEGGASADGLRGCQAIVGLIRGSGSTAHRIILPVGTGTTLAGVVAGLPAGHEVIGISALRGASDLEARVSSALQALEQHNEASHGARWRILHRDHCGGFARVSRELKEFMLAFEAAHGVALEPVYTGKMLLAIQRRLASGEWCAERPLLAIHTGGLQGRRGYPWLASG